MPCGQSFAKLAPEESGASVLLWPCQESRRSLLNWHPASQCSKLWPFPRVTGVESHCYVGGSTFFMLFV